MKYIKIFEDFTDDSTKSKRQIKSEIWHKNNPSPEGKILKVEDLPQFGIPESIIDMMKDWDVIYKSPYSKSFYSSNDISWSGKPDKSYRVSDHWNFTTNRTGDKKHCRTDKKVKDVTHFSIGIWDEKTRLYNILLSELTTDTKKRIEDNEVKLKYLKDPEVIYKKKLFKNRIQNGEIFATFTTGGKEYSGKIDKYTGSSIRIVDDSGNTIYSQPYEVKDLKISDKSGIIENPLA